MSLFEGVFATTTLRFWTGWGNLSWNSVTWLGNGTFQAIDGGKETQQLEATDLSIIFTGDNSTILSEILGDQKQNAVGNLYVGFLTSAGAVVADPYLEWSGLYSHAEIVETGKESTVTLFYESQLVEHQRPKEYRWTNDCQHYFFASDTGFSWVKAASNWNGTWGAEIHKPSTQTKTRSPKPKAKR